MLYTLTTVRANAHKCRHFPAYVRVNPYNISLFAYEIDSMSVFGSSGGYYIGVDISPERLKQITRAWFLRATFEIHQTSSTEKATQSAINAARMLVGMR